MDKLKVIKANMINEYTSIDNEKNRYSFWDFDLDFLLDEYAKAYHEAKLKEELMHFVDYTNIGYDHEKWDRFIDEYLAQR